MNKLYFFYSEDCNKSKFMYSIIKQIQSTGILVEKIDINSDNKLIKKFKIKSTPCIIKSNQRDKEYNRLEGVNNFDKIYKMFTNE